MISAKEVRKVSEEARKARKAQLEAAKNGGLSLYDKFILSFIERGIIRASKRGSFSYAAVTLTPAIKSTLQKNNYGVRLLDGFWVIYW